VPLSRFVRGEDVAAYDLRRKAFQEDGEPFECDLRMVRDDGTEFWAHLAATLSRFRTLVPEDGPGTGPECRVVLSDITERKQAVEKQQQVLEELVRKRTEALQEANRRKDEFLATLAHELRNPLAPIRNGAYILARRDDLDPEVRQILALIARQSCHMARMVDDLLDTSQIERGRVDLRKERVDLAQVLTQAIEACRPLFEAQEQRLTLALSRPLPELEADPICLEQMLCNLVSNASKFTPAGGEITVSAAGEGAVVVLAVRDNGVGMTPGTVDQSFDLFYQAAQTLDRPNQGLGIGLTLVRQLANLHGGSVLARSDGLGKGSEFLIRLPALESAPERPAAAQAAGREQPGRPKHVLIIDDDANVRVTEEMLLKVHHYMVILAATGKLGIELAKTLRPDIALIDLGMPGLNGLEVATRIRAELGQAIFLVAVTGYSRESDIASTRSAGFDRHLVKTGDPRELLDLLANIP
jgi:signal transduction histidine kinase